MAFKDVACLPGHLGQVSYDSWVPCTETGGKVVLGMGLSSCWYIALHYWIGLGMLVSKLGLNLDCQNSTFLLAQSIISKMLFLMSGSSKVAKAFLPSHVRERDKGLSRVFPCQGRRRSTGRDFAM